jgi:hypothetical protein
VTNERKHKKEIAEMFISDEVTTYTKQKYGHFKPFLSPIDLE